MKPHFFAEQLKAMREEAGLTLEAAAREISARRNGVTGAKGYFIAPYLKRIEEGATPLTVTVLEEIASIYGYELDLIPTGEVPKLQTI